MALATFVKNFQHGTILINDGTGTPLAATLTFDNGDFQASGITKTLREVVKYERRGALKSVGHTTRTYPTFTFSCMVAELTSATTGLAVDILLAQNAYSSAVSTLKVSPITTHPVYTVKLTFTIDTVTFESGVSSVGWVMNDCYITDIQFAEGDPDTLTFSGEVLGAMTGAIIAS